MEPSSCNQYAPIGTLQLVQQYQVKYGGSWRVDSHIGESAMLRFTAVAALSCLQETTGFGYQAQWYGTYTLGGRAAIDATWRWSNSFKQLERTTDNVEVGPSISTAILELENTEREVRSVALFKTRGEYNPRLQSNWKQDQWVEICCFWLHYISGSPTSRFWISEQSFSRSRNLQKPNSCDCFLRDWLLRKNGIGGEFIQCRPEEMNLCKDVPRNLHVFQTCIFVRTRLPHTSQDIVCCFARLCHPCECRCGGSLLVLYKLT